MSSVLSPLPHFSGAATGLACACSGPAGAPNSAVMAKRVGATSLSELSSTNSKKQAFARVVSELLDREEILQTEPGVYELKIDLP